MKALIIVDVQNDFLPGGALAVPDGNQVVPVINFVKPKFELVIATQDWHPAGHSSFASSHPGKKPGDIISLNGLDQILWPDHCVQKSTGASFASNLNIDHIEKVFRKGTDRNIDSYSGFYDNGHKKETGMNGFLHENGVGEIFIAGLAADYCVKFTALDGAQLGYRTHLVVDATRAVNMQDGDFDKAVKEMTESGVIVVHSQDLS